MTVYTYVRHNLLRHNILNNVRLFSCVLVLRNEQDESDEDQKSKSEWQVAFI